ncbi:MAG: EAL domain-containing protein [Clostridiales bacterium]|nr:EAL domain-containing protein [Candidatus Blautia equi]
MKGDHSQYYQMFEKFVINFEKMKMEYGPEWEDILHDLCDDLGIAVIRIRMFESEEDEKELKGYDTRWYGHETEDPERYIRNREIALNESIVYYEAYQFPGDEDWTEWESEKISVILRTLFALQGRIRSIRLSETLTYYDQQYQVPNMKYFFRALARMIKKNTYKDYSYCFFNFRRFSAINDQIGRDFGDLVMKRFLDRILAVLAPDESLCRIGGDHFTIIMKKEHLPEIQELLQGTNIVYDDCSKTEILVNTSAGFCEIREDEEITKGQTIFDRIMLASNIAKNVQGTSFVFYNQEMMDKQLAIQRIEENFPKALMDEEFFVYYQPKFSLEGDDYKLVGAEALCRWIHEGKMIPPDEFIPVLEKSVNISRLDFYMLDHVCRDLRRWMDEGKHPVKVSVNLSRKHSTENNLLNNILKVIDSYEVPHELVEIELTETSSDANFEELGKIVNGLRASGVITSVDDFGIGYSSLNLIRDIPWDILKIDKSFLPGAESSEHNDKKKVLLSNIISMAKNLGLQTIVEGVETPDQVDLLRENGCYMAQGYYFSTPLPVTEYEKNLE